MAAYDNVRVDTTFIGFFLIGFVLLMFGVLGLQDGRLFGPVTDPDNYTNLPIDYAVFSRVVVIVGALLILLTIFAYRTGRKESSGIFAIFGASFLFYGVSEFTKGEELVANSNWFLYVAIAILLLVIAIYALVAKTPKFVALLLLLVALMFFFFGMASYFYITGPGSGNSDVFHAMGIVYGIFAFLGFIIATYLGLAYANPKKIPLI